MTSRGIVAGVKPGSIAARNGLIAGDKLLTVNGQPLQDIIDVSFSIAEERLDLLVEKENGEQRTLKIRKKYHEDLGIEFENAVFDRVRRCANHCIFCFVDQMPSGMRDSLYVKDDDYRLSFLYGNFITLTNFGPNDMKRVRQLHLSPLYISVHTTDGELRAKMLGNDRARNIMTQLEELITSGVELHTQIVLCPEFNDRAALDKTIEDLCSRHPAVLSAAIVPVGLTQYRESCYPLAGFTPETALQVIEQVSRWQQRCRERFGQTFVYLADEFYLAAGQPIPEYDFYDDFPQLENGIGIVRNFIHEWEQTLPSGEGYHKPHYLDVVCGVSAAKVLQPLLADINIPNLFIRLVPVENHFFGPCITVTGLLTGQDILHALAQAGHRRDGVILPGVALRKGEQIFLDNMTLQDIGQTLGVPVRVAYFARDLQQLLTDWRQY